MRLFQKFHKNLLIINLIRYQKSQLLEEIKREKESEISSYVSDIQKISYLLFLLLSISFSKYTSHYRITHISNKAGLKVAIIRFWPTKMMTDGYGYLIFEKIQIEIFVSTYIVLLMCLNYEGSDGNDEGSP